MAISYQVSEFMKCVCEYSWHVKIFIPSGGLMNSCELGNWLHRHVYRDISGKGGFVLLINEFWPVSANRTGCIFTMRLDRIPMVAHKV